MPHEIGARVGAWLSATEDEVKLLGYGRYLGDMVPSEGVGGFGLMMREAGVTNPKIELDSGEVVWGCECWWGPEDKMIKKAGDRRIVQVDIKAMRAADAENGEKNDK